MTSKKSLPQICGTVGFFSSASGGIEPPHPPFPSVALKGRVVLKPQVVSVRLHAVNPLTISVFVATVFTWYYGTKYLNIGLTIYYAKSYVNEIDGDTTGSSHGLRLSNFPQHPSLGVKVQSDAH